MLKDHGIAKERQHPANTAQHMQERVFDEGHAGHVRRH
jgi:hypothetical protein